MKQQYYLKINDMKKRVFLIVLDSCGIGEMPDAADFGDKGTNTLKSISQSPEFNIINMKAMGYFNIDGVDYLDGIDNPSGAYGRLAERSKGKDTTVGHWEIGGVVSAKPLPTFPGGFPEKVINEFAGQTGRGVLCNKPYSGTAVINDYGEQHLETGDLIVYTSADSVFQVAANEAIVSTEQLYDYCRIARNILTGEYGVGRVIARPFAGSKNGEFTRTAGRHDFSLAPPKDTMLNCISNAGLQVLSVGKIYDIFAGSGITDYVFTHNNNEGMEKTLEYMKQDFEGLCFTNLVDFDMLYGHRRDVDGYANALSEFDSWLSYALPLLREDDMLIITADHGCDPAYQLTTDHTREYIPVLCFGKKIKSRNLGTMDGFCNIGKTICDYLGVDNNIEGNSFLGEIYDR